MNAYSDATASALSWHALVDAWCCGPYTSESQTSATGSGTDDNPDKTKHLLKDVITRVDHGGDRCLAVNRDDQHVRN
jgi:hypothetical protein